MKDLTIHKDGVVAFDKIAMEKLRDKLLTKKSSRITPKRVFLSRKNATYRRFNEVDIMKILSPLGFEIVQPENYTFEDQISLFNNAEWIIGGTGAAFTNVLFCRSNCKLLIIRATNIREQYPEFTTVSCINNCDMTYFLACQGKNAKSDHTDCVVDINALNDYVKYALS